MPWLICLLVAATSGCLTFAWIGYARSHQIQDLPGQRRLHRAATPRGGGIAIAVPMLAVLLLLAVVDPLQRIAWLGLAGGVGLFAALGLYDDLYTLSVPVKFILQLIAATIMIGLLSRLWSAPDWLLVLLVVFSCGLVVNLCNFMDGSNGLVVVQALLISLALAFWPGQNHFVGLAALTLAAACAGFLPFNLPLARVFLGDVGSHMLGALLFGLIVLTMARHSLSLPQALLIGSALLLDSVLTLLRRAISGRVIWRAHREHLYQYAVRKGNSHLQVCLAYGAWTLAAIVLAFLVNNSPQTTAWGILLLVVSLGILVYIGLRHRWLQRHPTTVSEHD